MIILGNVKCKCVVRTEDYIPMTCMEYSRLLEVWTDHDCVD